MSERQAKKFAAIVWCPQSNYFLLDKTARVNLIEKHTRLLFGTDSTLTSKWDIWDHLQSARKANLISDQSLYQTLNENAAKAWGLNSGEIAAGKDADIVVAKIKNRKTGFDAFFATGPADILLVVHKGNIRLFDETVLPQLNTVDLNNYSKIYIHGACKYVQGDLPGLMERIREYYPKADFHLNTSKAA
jgi:cytosine/adenosine deaminase-related metal-dependent hydrolase